MGRGSAPLPSSYTSEQASDCGVQKITERLQEIFRDETDVELFHTVAIWTLSFHKQSDLSIFLKEFKSLEKKERAYKRTLINLKDF